MDSFSLREIAQITSGKLLGDAATQITTIVNDSRNTSNPQGALFVAIEGVRHDGHRFIEDLITQRGFTNFLVKYIPENAPTQGVNYVVTDNTLESLQLIASSYRARFNCPVIGITGSNGKTIVKEWLYQLLNTDKSIARSPRSYNSQIGVALSVLNLTKGTDIGIFEAGISEVGEMEKLQLIINPEIGIFTNIGQAHQENFQSLLEKAKEKIKLFSNSKTLVYCSDYKEIEQAICESGYSCKSLSWSVSNDSKADLFVKSIQTRGSSTVIDAKYIDQKVIVSIPFTDKASIENSIHCWLLMLHLGYSNDIICERFAELSPVEMRLELKKGTRNCTLINDSYNSDMQSIAIALDFLNQQHQQEKKTLIISDVFQSGKDEIALYTELNKQINSKKIDRIIGVGEAISKHSDLFGIEKTFFTNTEQLLDNLFLLNLQNEAILIKGSRRFGFERIVASLEQKAHRTVMEVNLSAMIHNLNYFRSKLRPGTKLMVMVKAFSYGSGSYEVANMLKHQKVDYLAVAFADEGVLLRNSGISMPIVVMNPEETSFRQMIDYNLEPEIYSFRVLDLFLSILQKLDISNYPIHIKFDTGMHRLGFMPNEVEKLSSILQQNRHIAVSSAFTHLAGSDEEQHDDYTQRQYRTFVSMCSTLEQAIGYKFIRHLLNSAGIERFSHFESEMVRLGIGLYGISAVDQDKLRVVNTLKSFVSQIKTIPKGETIGYGRKGKANVDTSIAIVPIGYADGFNRKLSNGNGFMYVNGHRAHVIGNICMDMCMIDITGLTVHEGDDVEIFGNHIDVNEVANALNTISYEVFTSISSRVKRVYIQE